jgi:hypothetical protein
MGSPLVVLSWASALHYQTQFFIILSPGGFSVMLRFVGSSVREWTTAEDEGRDSASSPRSRRVRLRPRGVFYNTGFTDSNIPPTHKQHRKSQGEFPRSFPGMLRWDLLYTALR